MADQNYSTEPLSEKEIQQIRAVLEKEARWQWLAVMARNTAVYVTAIIAGLTIFWDTISKIVKGMVR